jgi:hypothetical protein
LEGWKDGIVLPSFSFGDAGAQAFVYTPTGKDNHSILLVQSASADVVTIGIPAD